MKKLHSALSVLLSIVLLVLSFASFVPAYAADAVSEFDFSAADALDAYDSYEKVVSADGYSYVETTLLNRIDTTSQKSFADYRYGAYLRDPEDRHYYSVFNLDYGGKITSNVLTIYADPDVRFEIIDVSGAKIADYAGQYDVSKITKYKRSEDFGHDVYYIQFNPMQSGQSRLMIEFSTVSNSVQPHYSFWFGNPLTRTGRNTYSFPVAVSVRKPNTSTPTNSIYSYYFTQVPEVSWITSVVVNKTSEDYPAWISSAYFTVVTPGNTTAKSQSTSPISTKFTFDVNNYSANSAYGEYKFKITSVTWNSLPSPATYTYHGSVYVNYLYAFGA